MFMEASQLTLRVGIEDQGRRSRLQFLPNNRESKRESR